jgi:hypothetical protein
MAMSVDEKTQHCLQLLLLRLFDLELRVIEMRTPLFSPNERRQLEAVHTAAMDGDGELALQQYFKGLRRQAGARRSDASRDVSSASSADVWAALHHADRRATDAELLEEEWRQLWDLL